MQEPPSNNTPPSGTDRSRLLNRSSCPVWFKQAVKFGLVGLLNTAIDLGLYFTLTRWVGFFNSRLVFAKTISYSAGVLNSFFWNRAWTFRSRAGFWRTFIPFMLTNLAGTGINAGVMHLTLNALRLPEILALVLATGVTLLWNFSVSKFLIFRR